VLRCVVLKADLIFRSNKWRLTMSDEDGMGNCSRRLFFECSIVCAFRMKNCLPLCAADWL
jgi:hypothetical protein